MELSCPLGIRVWDTLGQPITARDSVHLARSRSQSYNNIKLKKVIKFCETQAASTPPEKFENGVFTLKTHEVFNVCSTPVILCLGKTQAGKSHNYRGITVYRFQKALFSKCSLSTLERKPAFSNSSGLKSVFEKLRFRVDCRPNRRNKAAFLYFTTWCRRSLNSEDTNECARPSN